MSGVLILGKACVRYSLPSAIRFVVEGEGQRQPVASMPGVERLSIDLLVEAAREGLLPMWASLRPRGGKLDDCTVVAAYLVPVDAAAGEEEG